MGRHNGGGGGGGGGYAPRPSTRSSTRAIIATDPTTVAQVLSPIVDPVLTPSLQDSTTPTVQNPLPPPQDSARPSVQDPLPPTQGSVIVQHEPTPPPAGPRRVRGPTTRSVETSLTPGAPRTRVEFYRGRSCTQAFTTTVGQWIRSPTTLPYNVKQYKDIHIDFKIAFFERMNDTFDMIELQKDPNETGQFSTHPVVSTSNTSASSSASAPTPTSQRSSSRDPTECLPLSFETRKAIEGWVRDRYMNHRSDICEKYYDAYETDEERYEHTPPLWPEDQWRWVVHYWGTEEYKKIRSTRKINRSKLEISHTGGSVNYQKLRVQIMKDTKADVDEREFFILTHKSKKKKDFIDERSKEIVENMDALVREHTTESGVCTLPSQQVRDLAMGPGTKGRERGQGRVAKPPKSKITSADMERACQNAREEMREEMREALEANRQNTQSQINEAVETALRLFRESLQQNPPTQGTGSQQPPFNDADNYDG